VAGLLDYITNPVGTVGAGLLGNLFDYYRNMPQPQADNSGPQYDPMGSFTGVMNPAPQTAPAPSVFSTGAPAFTPSPTLPQAQAPAPQPQLENPIAVGNYQMPRIGNPDQYVPQQAMTPSNATPTQGQLQQPPQNGTQPLPQNLPPALGGRPDGFFDRINTGLQSIGNGGSLIGALTGNRTDPQSVSQKNLTAQFQALHQALMQSGMPPQQAYSKAMIAVLNPKAGEAIFSQAFGNKEPPKSVEEFAVRNAWEARNGMTPRGAAPGESGMPTTLADLEKYKLDQKAAEKRATTIAEKQGEAAASLPNTLARAEQTIKQIDELKGHPAKGYRTGMGSILPAVPGFKGVDFDERVKQIKGGAFLDAYKMLRGTGAISEAEGAKAEQAQARLSQAKDQKDFDQALDDLRSVVAAGYERAQKMAGEEKVTPYQMPVGQSRNIGGVTIKRVN
jgi:hypothetical protein